MANAVLPVLGPFRPCGPRHLVFELRWASPYFGPWRQYSYLGGKGVLPVTIVQNYPQGESAWGRTGMAALWNAAIAPVAIDPRCVRSCQYGTSLLIITAASAGLRHDLAGPATTQGAWLHSPMNSCHRIVGGYRHLRPGLQSSQSRFRRQRRTRCRSGTPPVLDRYLPVRCLPAWKY